MLFDDGIGSISHFCHSFPLRGSNWRPCLVSFFGCGCDFRFWHLFFLGLMLVLMKDWELKLKKRNSNSFKSYLLHYYLTLLYKQLQFRFRWFPGIQQVHHIPTAPFLPVLKICTPTPFVVSNLLLCGFISLKIMFSRISLMKSCENRSSKQSTPDSLPAPSPHFLPSQWIPRPLSPFCRFSVESKLWPYFHPFRCEPPLPFQFGLSNPCFKSLLPLILCFSLAHLWYFVNNLFVLDSRRL